MKLKPCPFCGGKCCVCESGCRGWMAHCHDCDCTITVDKYNNAFATQVQADMAWNTRAEPKDPEPQKLRTTCNCDGKIEDTGYCSLHDRYYR